MGWCTEYSGDLTSHPTRAHDNARPEWELGLASTGCCGRIASTGSTANPHRYVGALGYFAEPGLGLNYVRARWLRPSTGSWLSADPVSGEPRYGYVRGGPTWAVDGAGLQWGPPPSTPPPAVPYGAGPVYGNSLLRIDQMPPGYDWTQPSEPPPPPPPGRGLCQRYVDYLGHLHDTCVGNEFHPPEGLPLGLELTLDYVCPNDLCHEDLDAWLGKEKELIYATSWGYKAQCGLYGLGGFWPPALCVVLVEAWEKHMILKVEACAAKWRKLQALPPCVPVAKPVDCGPATARLPVRDWGRNPSVAN